MKNFLKRANRGLILGAVVLVGFIAFVITDTARFKKNKPQIEAGIRSYVDALAECAVTPDSKEEFQEKNNELVNSCWCSDADSGTNYQYGTNISSYRSQLQYVADESFSNKKDTGKVTGWKANLHDFNITKSGGKFAKVDFYCDITADFVGDPYLISPSDIIKISDYAYYGDDAHEAAIKSNQPQKMSTTIEYVAQMKEIDGKWKIARIDSWGWHNVQITASDEAEGGTQ